MRTGIINEVHQLMRENKNIYFLTGDLGYSLLEQIEKNFPKRFINIGVAEQNMIGIAAGLALSGKKVFVYSIIPFAVMRCYEQIRNDICFHDLDVTILGVGAGLSYGVLSNTHFALEDIAILRPLPNISIFSPADETEGILGIRFLKNFHHPVYFRIGKGKEPVVYKKSYDFDFRKGVVLRKGSDITIFSTGPIITEALKASMHLCQRNKINTTLINIHTIKPLDKDLIIKASKGKKLIVAVEEHGITGGLGSAVLEVLNDAGIKNMVLRIGVKNNLIKYIGTQTYLRKKLRLNSDGIYKQIWAAFKTI